MKKVSEANAKLAIIACLLETLSAWDTSLIDKIASEVELVDGSKFTIEIRMDEPPQC